jgi:hypothetical protein
MRVTAAARGGPDVDQHGHPGAPEQLGHLRGGSGAVPERQQHLTAILCRPAAARRTVLNDMNGTCSEDAPEGSLRGSGCGLMHLIAFRHLQAGLLTTTMEHCRCQPPR